MYNDWFHIGPVTIHGYGVMIALGILAAFYVCESLGKKHGLETEKIDNLVFICLAAGWGCSKLFYCLTNWKTFLQNPLAVLGSGGWVVYGGIIGGILGAMAYAKKNRWNFMKYFNTLICSVALAQGFGRLGCFLAGCCYGRETSHFGVVFPEGSLAPAGVPLIPTQLISSALDFLLFFILWRNLEKGKHPEDTGALYLMLYSIGRFMIEFIRGDEIRGYIGPFTTSQFIALFLFLLGAYLIWRRQRREEKTAQ